MKIYFVIIFALIIIFGTILHPEMIAEQFGVISREKINIYDYIIMFGIICMLISIFYLNLNN